MNEAINKILKNYDIGIIESINKIPTGNINKTFYIRTNRADFVLQKMGDIFNEKTIEDMELVTQHLKNKNTPTPELIKTTQGQIYIKDTQEKFWRLMTAIDGTTHDVLTDVEMVEEAGRVLAEFHSAMQDFDTKQLESPLKLHQTKQIFEDYKSVYKNLLKEDNEKLRNGYTYIFENFEETFLPDGLPTTVVHADPKISNIIFQDKKANCMIDLDTCMEHSALVDLGDALRSWCGKEEDDPENKFSIPLFEAAMRGYMGVIPLSVDEQHYVYRATRMITLELASRFAKDVIDDNYFGFDNKKYATRKDHNKARAYSMIKLEQDIVSKKDRIIDILNNI